MRDAQRVAGRYEVLREIGRGGMATVYLARQIDLDRLIALKELRALRSDDDPSLARRFVREAKLAGSLSHPNIVTVHDYFVADEVPHIAMEYLERGSLRPFVGRLSPAQVGRVLEGLLAGLAEAERHDVVHRDIKPENLLVTGEGGVKIADFGIAKATKALEQSALLTANGMAVGTPSYIAPEQAMARELGPWTDLYSVGVTTFELFSGRTPFADTPEAMAVVLRQINEPIPPLISVIPNADPWLSKWIEWLVAKDPARRPQSAAEAWEGLEEALIRLLGPRWRRGAQLAAAAAAPVPTPRTRPVGDPRRVATVPPRRRRTRRPEPAPAVPPRKRRRRRRPSAAQAGVLVAALTAIAILFGKGGGGPPSTPAGQNVALPTVAAPTTTVAAPAQSAAATQALAQAKSYRNAASRLASQPGAKAKKQRVAYVQVAAAYERAGAAAQAGDLVGYDTAIAAAATKQGAVLAAGAPVPAQTTVPAKTSPANGQPTTSPSTTTAWTTTARTTTARTRTTAPAPPTPTGGCGGDSTSDDPSDDSCQP